MDVNLSGFQVQSLRDFRMGTWCYLENGLIPLEESLCQLKVVCNKIRAFTWIPNATLVGVLYIDRTFKCSMNGTCLRYIISFLREILVKRLGERFLMFILSSDVSWHIHQLRHAGDTEPLRGIILARGHLIWPPGHLVWHSVSQIDHQSSRS